MKINSIQSYTHTPHFTAENKPAQNPTEEHKSSTKKNLLVYGVPALGAIGFATFMIIKTKKSPAKAIKEAQDVISKKTGEAADKVDKTLEKSADDLLKKDMPKPDAPKAEVKEPLAENIKTDEPKQEIKEPPAENVKTDETIQEIKEPPAENVKTDEPKQEVKEPTTENVKTDEPKQEVKEPTTEIVKTDEPKQEVKSTIIEVTEKPFSTTPVGSDKSFDGYEKLIYTDNGNGTGHTYQRFYHKDKMFESQVFDDILDGSSSPVKVTRYNYAYENGKLVGVAKQDIYKDGNSHGTYNKDGLFEPFHIFVKMKGEKEFQDANIYMPEQLFEKDGRFDPHNL